MPPIRRRMIVVLLAVAAPLAAACQTPAPRSGVSSAPAPDTTGTPTATTTGHTVRPAPPVRRPRVPAGMTVGYAVYDRTARRVTVQYNARHRFRSASVVKILIALDYLTRRRAGTAGTAIPAGDRALLRSMLRSSDDDAATTLWTRGGRVRIIDRMTAALKLADTRPPPAGKPGFWGYTAISAADMVRIYRYLLDPAHRRVGDFIMGHLRRATRCGADGFDQSFGIPSALTRPWAVKQGWSGYGSVPPRPCVRASTNALGPAAAARAAAPGIDLVRPVLHTTGTAGPADRMIVVVLSLHPPGSSWRASTTRLTAFTKAVYRAGG